MTRITALGIVVEIPQPDLRRCEELQRIARPLGNAQSNQKTR